MSDNEGAQEKTITLQLKGQNDDEPVFFKVKKETKMSKVFGAYASRKGQAVESLKFSFDGNVLNPTDTPKMLEMEENDMIDVFLTQVGGGEEGQDGEGKTLMLTVKDQTGDEMSFKVKKETKLNKIFKAYADSKGVAVDSLRFTLDGERLKDDTTPKMLELVDGDQIDVSLDMVGGF